MSFSIKFTNEAESNIEDALAYYSNVVANSRITSSLKLDIQSAVLNLELNPHLNQIRYRDIRIQHLSIFSYGFHYRINGDKIKVVKFLHQKQFYK